MFKYRSDSRPRVFRDIIKPGDNVWVKKNAIGVTTNIEGMYLWKLHKQRLKLGNVVEVVRFADIVDRKGDETWSYLHPFYIVECLGERPLMYAECELFRRVMPDDPLWQHLKQYTKNRLRTFVCVSVLRKVVEGRSEMPSDAPPIREEPEWLDEVF